MFKRVISAALACVLAASAAHAVSNGDFSSGTFDTPSSTVSPATNWDFNDSGATITLLSDFMGKSNVLHIVTTGSGSGIYQFPVVPSGEYGIANVFVASGGAYFWMCNSFCTTSEGTFSISNYVTGSWQTMALDSGDAFINEAGIYGVGGPSDFYVDLIDISNTPPSRENNATSPAPEPATWATMLAGFGLVGSAMRSRRKALA